MNSNLRERAQQLASRKYIDVVRLDETTEGKPIFIAMNPELEGCISQGHSVEAAKQNLYQARADFIESLLEDDLPVPGPARMSTITTAMESSTFVIKYYAESEEREFDTIFTQQPLENAFGDALVVP